MASFLILILTILLAVFHWLAVYKNWILAKRITALFTILGLLGWLVVVSTTQKLSLTGPSLVWFIIAILISLFAYFLCCLSSKNFYFLAGIILLTTAQFGYIIGLNPVYPEFPAPKLILAALILIPVVQTGKTIVCGIHQKKQDHLTPLALLSLVICSVLVFSGISTLIEGELWADVDAYLVSSGVILLFLYFILVTFNYWVRPLQKVELKTAFAFFSGTILLVVGSVLHLT